MLVGLIHLLTWWQIMKINEFTDRDFLELPKIAKGDSIMIGKFKNRKATVKGFDNDEHGQPVLKTDRGDQKLFKPRITKLMPDREKETK